MHINVKDVPSVPLYLCKKNTTLLEYRSNYWEGKFISSKVLDLMFQYN